MDKKYELKLLAWFLLLWIMISGGILLLSWLGEIDMSTQMWNYNADC